MRPSEAEIRHHLARNPADLGLNFQLGEELLRKGDFRAGWFYREFTPKRYLPPQDGRMPWLWQGENPSGKTLLVFPDEGYGDMIQYFPLLGWLARSGVNVIFQVPRALHRLFALNAPEGVTFLVWEEQPDHKDGFSADFYCAITSLPWLMLMLADDLPLGDGYLKPAENDAAAWRERLAHVPGPRVGVVWQGNPKHGNDKRRSVPAAALEGLFSPDWSTVSLQVGPAAAEAAPYGLFDCSAHIADFADTAACVAALDAVVTVDTAPAHLAGAVGVPTFVLVGELPDWRWGTEDAPLPWYPSLRSLRQTVPGDWSGSVAAAKAALTAMFRP
jgi:hypothetical protein